MCDPYRRDLPNSTRYFTSSACGPRFNRTANHTSRAHTAYGSSRNSSCPLSPFHTHLARHMSFHRMYKYSQFVSWPLSDTLVMASFSSPPEPGKSLRLRSPELFNLLRPGLFKINVSVWCVMTPCTRHLLETGMDSRVSFAAS